MKLKVRKSPKNTIELSELLGIQVTKWTIHPNGSMEFDLDVASLSSEDKQAAIDKLVTAQISLVEDVE